MQIYTIVHFKFPIYNCYCTKPNTSIGLGIYYIMVYYNIILIVKSQPGFNFNKKRWVSECSSAVQ